jgi:hypothetical protein
MQLFELGALFKDIENRIGELESLKKAVLTRDKIVAILQDFTFCKDLNINFEKLSEVLLFSGNDRRGIAEVLESIFRSNKKYFKVLSTLERFNEVKRIMDKETDANLIRENLLQFQNQTYLNTKMKLSKIFYSYLGRLRHLRARVKKN